MPQDGMLDLFVPAVDPAIQSLHDSTACYTQEAVIDEVLDEVAWPAPGARLLDPGAGDGGFMLRAIARLDLETDDVDLLRESIEGWEIHPEAARMARERIARHLVERGWTPEVAEDAAWQVLIEADFLAPGPVARNYTVVAGNPPYLRFGHLPDAFKARYQEVVPDFARRDLLHAFLHRCAEVLTDDGQLACVTADRWLFNESAASLREQIGARFGVEQARRIEASTAFHRAKTRRKGTPPRVHPVIVVLTPERDAEQALTREPIYPGRPVAVPADAAPLGRSAQVRLAPWLGPHGVFTVDRDVALTLPRELLVPCVDTNDMENGELQRPRRWAIRTERDVMPPESVVEHLRANWDLLPNRARRNLDETNWWLPPETWGPFPLEQEVLLVPRIAQGLRPIRLPAGLLPINHNLTVVAAGDMELDALEEALRSELAEALIEQRAPRLENGYYSITTRFLRDLPIVRPDAEERRVA